jgi:hypothetical protein
MGDTKQNLKNKGICTHETFNARFIFALALQSSQKIAQNFY